MSDSLASAFLTPDSLLLRDIYTKIKKDLGVAGHGQAALEARLLIQHVLDLSHADFIAKSGEIHIERGQYQRIFENLEQLKSGTPFSRITNIREFWGLDFQLSEATLDPRPETERIIEIVLERFKNQKNDSLKILDLGTGTGCLLITLLTLFPEAKGIGVDLSEKALETARINAQNHNVLDRITLIQSDWTENIEGEFDLIISNPPYIRRGDITNLDKNVKNHDPVLALDGGENGLEAYEKILSGCFLEKKGLLKTLGIMLCEIGFDQADDLKRICKNYDVLLKHVHSDHAGLPRVIELERNNIGGDK